MSVHHSYLLVIYHNFIKLVNMSSDLNNKSYPDIWVLVDNRTGGANQALALALDHLPGFPYFYILNNINTELI